MADFNTLFKVLNTINALTTPNELTDKMGSKINEMIQSLSPSEKKQAKDALKEKKKEGNGMRYGGKASKKCSMNRDNRNTRKVNNQETTVADFSKYTTAELEAMLAKMKAEKAKTGSTLSVDQIRNAQKRINKQETKIPSNIKIYGKGSGTRKVNN